MAEKTGAGGKPQDFDSNSGRYVKGSGQGYNSQSDIQPLKNAVEQKAKSPETVYGFANKKLKNLPDHIQHAKEMGFKNQDEYENAAAEFWNSPDGEIYYGSKRGRFAKYNEKTGEYAVVDVDGNLKTYYKISLKKFKRIKEQEGF
ncbi:MAG: hypothetical protein K2I29_05655 [Clostridia bacterium]|nr:hypothetical protein [Clostridia bacterium]